MKTNDYAHQNMGVSKNRGNPPKMDGWFIMENPYFFMDDFRGKPLFLETPIWFAWDFFDLRKFKSWDRLAVLGDEERDPRGDEERLGWMATHPGAALLQARGGQVYTWWERSPAFRSTISGWKTNSNFTICSSFFYVFFHRVVFNSWKQNHLKLSLIIQCAEILVGVLEHQGHPFIEFR